MEGADTAMAAPAPPAPATATAPSGPATAMATDEAVPAMPGGAAATSPAPAAAARPLPYTRKVLMKFLLRAIAVSSYAANAPTSARPQVG